MHLPVEETQKISHSSNITMLQGRRFLDIGAMQLLVVVGSLWTRLCCEYIFAFLYLSHTAHFDGRC